MEVFVKQLIASLQDGSLVLVLDGKALGVTFHPSSDLLSAPKKGDPSMSLEFEGDNAVLVWGGRSMGYLVPDSGSLASLTGSDDFFGFQKQNRCAEIYDVSAGAPQLLAML
jgi:hypothetical protein